MEEKFCLFLCLRVFVVCCDLAPPRQEPSLISDQYLQFTLEDARERLSSLAQSPDRSLRSRLDTTVLTSSSPSCAADKGECWTRESLVSATVCRCVGGRAIISKGLQKLARAYKVGRVKQNKSKTKFWFPTAGTCIRDKILMREMLNVCRGGETGALAAGGSWWASLQ